MRNIYIMHIYIYILYIYTYNVNRLTMNPVHRLIIPDIEEAEARGLWVRGMSGLHSAFKVNLSNFVRPCL